MNFKHIKRITIALSLYCIINAANAQTAKQVFSNAGIWQDYAPALKASSYPEFKGRLVNVNWSDIETANNV